MRQYGITSILVTKFLQDFTFGIIWRDTGVLRGNLCIRQTRGTGIFDWYILFVRGSVYESLSRT
ncbi:hypothetical protein M404DRAFT_1003991 [Pisolithus tinctorius Marx 270]|uniref:Uncharacterized protein n=1 Tax=Pisolithus tinctorius Marx 270 TaxID=870435 RepID=A0A0C3ITS6_PISTI|nr:hypothetical protein M404DRAFT_1003991 [Pisolithus tinctorius Marx 270]